MRVKILYLIDSYGGFEDSDDLEDFVEKDNFNYHSIETSMGLVTVAKIAQKFANSHNEW